MEKICVQFTKRKAANRNIELNLKLKKKKHYFLLTIILIIFESNLLNRDLRLNRII